MPADEMLLSLGLGAGLGVAYIVASYFSNRRALKSKDRFMAIVVTTMLIRILLALIILIGITLLLPVSPTAFLGSFFVVFVIGLILEVWFLHEQTLARDDARNQGRQ